MELTIFTFFYFMWYNRIYVSAYDLKTSLICPVKVGRNEPFSVDRWYKLLQHCFCRWHWKHVANNIYLWTKLLEPRHDDWSQTSATCSNTKPTAWLKALPKRRHHLTPPRAPTLRHLDFLLPESQPSELNFSRNHALAQLGVTDTGHYIRSTCLDLVNI
jgi:hypothetical protein